MAWSSPSPSAPAWARALFTSGRLCPGLELGHHPWNKHTYEDYIGRRGLDKYGKKHWNKLLLEAIEQTAAHLQLGPPLPRRRQHQEDRLRASRKNVTIVSNETGLLGGVALWRDETLAEKKK